MTETVSLSRKGKILVSLRMQSEMWMKKMKKNLQVISQHNEKVETDSLTMITGNIPEKYTNNAQA